MTDQYQVKIGVFFVNFALQDRLLNLLINKIFFKRLYI